MSGAELLLQRQLKELSKNPIEGFSVGLVEDDIFEWEIMMIGPSNTLYEGGFFPAHMSFPRDYPLSPPVVRFTKEMWHPNVFPDGTVCISILHPPVEDAFQYENIEERWSPVQTVETIVLSIISLFASPNDESPANVDAAKEWREDREAYKQRVKNIVRRSQEMD